MKNDFRIETERLILAKPQKSDLEVIFEATRVKGFNDGMLWDPPEKIEDMYPFLDELIKSWEKNLQYCFSIYEKENNNFVGRVTLRPDSEAVWDLGYFIVPKQQSNGYMTESVKALINFAFTTLKAKEVIGKVADWNKSSRGVLINSNMKLKETNRDGFVRNGTVCDEEVYFITN